jgi:DNA-directed RNA polymerase specialized sigma24 family protein
VVEATQDDLRRLLKRLDPDPAIAWETYLTVWQKLVMFFQHNGCPPATDYADEALSRIARQTDLDSIQNLGAFAYGVARKMRSEIAKKQGKEVPLNGFPEGDIMDTASQNRETDLVERIDMQRNIACFLQCLEQLPADDRATFLAFKLADRDTRIAYRSTMAMRNGVSPATLRVRVSRTGRELERCVRKCLGSRGHSGA